MKKTFLTTAFIVICNVTFCIASPSIDQAKRFIKEFLEAEFDGQRSFRVDNVIYSAERGKLIKELYGPMIGEIFYWDST